MYWLKLCLIAVSICSVLSCLPTDDDIGPVLPLEQALQMDEIKQDCSVCPPFSVISEGTDVQPIKKVNGFDPADGCAITTMECTGTNDAKETYFSWDKDFFKSNDETPVIVKRTAKCDGLGNWIVQDKTRTFGAKDVACISSSKSTPKCAKCKIWEEKKTVFDDFQPIGITKADKTKDGCIQQRISCKPKSHKEFGIIQWEFAKISKGDNAGEELSTILTCDENEKWTLPLGLKNQNDPEVNEAQCTSKLAKHIEKEKILRLPGAAKEEIVCKRDCGTIGKIGEKNVVENWGDPTCLTAEITCNVGDSKPVTLQFEERAFVLATLQGNGETKVMVKCGENNGKWVYTDPDNNDFEFNDVTCSETVN